MSVGRAALVAAGCRVLGLTAGMLAAPAGALLAALRDPSGTQEQIRAVAPELAPHRYLLLATIKRDGTEVPTPVWFAPDGDRLVVMSQAEAWKVKRLRHTPEVFGAGCDVRGRQLGPRVDLVGHELTDAGERSSARRALDRRYGVAGRAIRAAYAITRSDVTFLALRPA